MALVRMIMIGACLVTLFFRTALSDEAPVVTVKGGSLMGAYVQAKGSEKVGRFLGVPFARPPVGPLRFSKPQPPLPWKGERDATHEPNMCLQDPDSIVATAMVLSINHTIPPVSEDCLYLNVYAPLRALSGEKAPVMVWIHGGGLVMGCAAQYDGTSLAAYQHVVVVIIQYRLGIPGFLSTGDEHAPGNWGFWDQLAALHWIQDNIESFGGDPKSVTIFGESAGGISASILMLSPLSTGLFHKAILQSGVATVGTFSNTDSISQAKMVANLTGCSHDVTEQLVQCLKLKTAEDIINATKKLRIFFGASVDGVFLKKTGEELLKNKEFLRVPVLLGATDDEFGWILPQTFLPAGWEKGVNSDTVMHEINLFNPKGANGANELIAKEYLADAQTPEAIRDGLTEMLGDIFMVLPTINVARYHRDAGVPVYLYEFRHRPEAHQSRPDFVRADHASEIGFVFGGCFWEGPVNITGPITAEEDELCRTMMAYWANFARTGSPNGEGLVRWPVYGETEEYLKFDLKPSVGQKLKENRVLFMNVTLSELLAKPTPNKKP